MQQRRTKKTPEWQSKRLRWNELNSILNWIDCETEMKIDRSIENKARKSKKNKQTKSTAAAAAVGTTTKKPQKEEKKMRRCKRKTNSEKHTYNRWNRSVEKGWCTICATVQSNKIAYRILAVKWKERHGMNRSLKGAQSTWAF